MVHEEFTRAGRHRGSWVEINGKRVLIDRKIASLIHKLNALGIKTTNSCQNSCGGWCNKTHVASTVCRDVVWIAFRSAQDGEKFLSLLYTGKEDYLFDLMRGYLKEPNSWCWKVAYGVNSLTDHIVSCVFPHEHLRTVIRRIMKRHNNKPEDS